jgi:hypothetical protein
VIAGNWSQYGCCRLPQRTDHPRLPKRGLVPAGQPKEAVEVNDEDWPLRVELVVQRDFRKVMNTTGLIGKEWTPRELRQSFVSLLSDERVPLEVISRLVGHRTTTVTETVYRKQLRPVIEGGADTMDRIFPPAADSGP